MSTPRLSYGPNCSRITGSWTSCYFFPTPTARTVARNSGAWKKRQTAKELASSAALPRKRSRSGSWRGIASACVNNPGRRFGVIPPSRKTSFNRSSRYTVTSRHPAMAGKYSWNRPSVGTEPCSNSAPSSLSSNGVSGSSAAEDEHGNRDSRIPGGDPHQLAALVPAFDDHAADEADPLRVLLDFDLVGAQPRPFPGLQDVVETAVGDTTGEAQPEHRRLILRHALGEFLVIMVPRLRSGLHDDAGNGAVHPGLPGALRADHVAVLIELSGVFAEIPDVALDVLGIPVGGVLGELPVLEGEVAHHRAGDAQDLFGLVGDEHLVDGGCPVLHPLVEEGGARLEREVRVGDLADEIGGVDVRGWPARQGERHRQGHDESGQTWIPFHEGASCVVSPSWKPPDLPQAISRVLRFRSPAPAVRRREGEGRGTAIRPGR